MSNRHAKKHLKDKEVIKASVSCQFGQSAGSRRQYDGFLYVTDRRLLYVSTDAMQRSGNALVMNRKGANTHRSFPYEELQSVSAHRGMLYAKIYVATDEAQHEFAWASKAGSEAFANAAERALAAYQSAATRGEAPPSAADELTKLAALVEKGFLSEEEFQREKTRLLSNA